MPRCPPQHLPTAGIETHILGPPSCYKGFPGGTEGKESACNAGDPGSIPRQGDPLEKGMATNSCILAWRIPWTEEPGQLQSTGSQRVAHDE